MAVFTRQVPVVFVPDAGTAIDQRATAPPGAAPPVPPAGGGAGNAAAVDDVTAATSKAVYPELRHLLAAGVAIVIGVVLGTWGYDHWSSGVTFTPPEGINTFALFYLMAQVIERIQEPFTPFVTAPEASSADPSRKNEKTAKAELEQAVAEAERNPSEATTTAVANKKRNIDQIRANATVLLFGTSSLLAMLLVGYLKADLVKTIGVSGSTVWFDVAMTGLAVGAGTKPLHDLISNLKEAKEKKQDPAGT